MTVVSGKWVTNPATQRIFSLLERAGWPAYFVGGCVRNALMGRDVADIDIATPARPEEVTRICQSGGLKVVATGIDHGTVTVVSGGGVHEVTTFRRDVETDGRRAVVEFADDIAEDARRRDFTMNALYADATGRVTDPLGGLGDLRAGRVRFIEDAGDRIREDYLRILRFFRFHAWYGHTGMDPEALAAIAANLGGLETLSAERIGAEIMKLLAASDPAPALATMAHCGVLAWVLPGAEPAVVARLVAIEAGTPADPVRRLAALGGADPADRLRLSRHDAKRRALMIEVAESGTPDAVLAYRHGEAIATSGALIRAASLGSPAPPDLRAEVARGAAARFPLSARDLMPDLSGPALGARLRALEERWIGSDFRLTRDELLNLPGR